MDGDAIILMIMILLPLIMTGAILILNILIWGGEKRNICVKHTILLLLVGLHSLGNITLLPVIIIVLQISLMFGSIYLRVKKWDILSNISLILVSILAVLAFFMVTDARYF